MSELRRDLLLRTAVDVLLEADAPVPAASVVEAVAKRVDLNDHERSVNNSGFPRFDTFVRFASGWMASVGWIEKSPAGWRITFAGRAAAEAYDPVDFHKELSRLYRQTRKSATPATSTSSASGWSDPRWQTVRDAVAAIPPGSWTAYQDLADLVGIPARTIGTFLSSGDVEGAYRVLTVDGSVASQFRWSDPSKTDDPRDVLAQEGVEFDPQGHASPAQRVTVDELRELVGTPTPGRRAWLVRGSAVSGVNVVGTWRQDGFVSIAASHLRPLEPGQSLDELRAAVDQDYAHLSYNQKKAKLAELQAFLNRMQPGDAVMTVAEGVAYLGRITGDVIWKSGEPLTTVRRDVEWQPEARDFTQLPDVLQAKLKSSATVVDLTDTVDAVETLFGTDDEQPQPPLPEADLADLTQETRDRLLVGGAWLDEFVDLLRHQRQVILYGPPGTGKTYLALEVAAAVTDPANVSLVQFHPAYSYEDFFEGYRPSPVDDSGRVGFVLTPGPFRKLVDQAREDPGRPYVLIIDEINRANLAKVFGELYFLLEYRDRPVDLMYASGDEGRDFTLPKNVYIVGTMNTADRSISSIDAAMRRRFAFLSLHPDDPHMRGVLRAWLTREGFGTEGADLLDALNARISERDYKVGPSYLMRRDAASDSGLQRIWRTGILPLLEELHVGDPGYDVESRYGLAALRRTLAPTPPA